MDYGLFLRGTNVSHLCYEYSFWNNCCKAHNSKSFDSHAQLLGSIHGVFRSPSCRRTFEQIVCPLFHGMESCGGLFQFFLTLL